MWIVDRRYSPTRIIMGVILLLGLIAGCQPSSSDTPSTPTPLAIAKSLATLAPTNTPDSVQVESTRQAVRIAPTNTPQVAQSSPTPYIGIFLGEADLGEDGQVAGQFNLPPTRAQQSVDLPGICALEPGSEFGTRWASDSTVTNTLRCPIQQSFGFTGTVQIFERGVVYYREETNEVWAIARGTLATGGRYWYISPVPQGLPPPPEIAPEGLLMPDGAIGTVWSTTQAVREGLGYAATEEEPIDVNIQRFNGGSLLLDATVGQVFALLANGNAYGPY